MWASRLHGKCLAVRTWEDALASKNRARWELLGPYRRAFAKLEFPQADAAKRAIDKIAQHAAFGQGRFTSATTGRSDPVARMTAARMAAA